MIFWLNWDITCLLWYPKNNTVYYSLFDTHLYYACQVWGQSNSDILVMLQRAQIINFKEEIHPSAPL